MISSGYVQASDRRGSDDQSRPLIVEGATTSSGHLQTSHSQGRDDQFWTLANLSRSREGRPGQASHRRRSDDQFWTRPDLPPSREGGPVLDTSRPLTVAVGFTPVQMLSYDEHEQIISLVGWLNLVRMNSTLSCGRFLRFP